MCGASDLHEGLKLAGAAQRVTILAAIFVATSVTSGKTAADPSLLGGCGLGGAGGASAGQ